MKRTSWVRVLALAIALSIAPQTGVAQEIEPYVHWAYASYLGTGWYKVGDERSAFIMRAAPRWQRGEAGYDENGKRELAYTFRVPMTLGLTKLDFDDIPGIIDSENFSTASINFGMDVDIPITERYSIRPHMDAGYGTVLNESESALTYMIGIKSRYKMASEKLDWSLLLDVVHAGYDARITGTDDFAAVSIGAEFAYPLNRTTLYWHANYVDFIDKVKFVTGFNQIDSVSNYIQLGMAMGKRDGPIRIWFLKFDRLGLAYNYSTTGDMRGVKFVFRSLYDL